MKISHVEPEDRIILALDVDTLGEAERLVALLKGHVGAFKVGFELFVAAGPGAVRAITAGGARVFLDLKFHDIPNTVGGAVRAATGLGASFVDVHASGGRAMMTAAARAARAEAERLGINPPVMLAVTVLTSLGEEDLRDDLNIGASPEEQVVSLARLARECGMDGIVASPREISAIRKAVGGDFVIVTPGVRPGWAAVGDQRRVATPGDAVAAGADYLVIGRPITASDDPVGSAVRIADEISGADITRSGH